MRRAFDAFIKFRQSQRETLDFDEVIRDYIKNNSTPKLPALYIISANNVSTPYGRKETAMEIYFTVKSIGKRKPFLTKKEHILSYVPATLKELITEIVAHHVREYNERNEESQLIAFLTEEEISTKATLGKVGFGSKYDDRQANEEASIQTALVAFEDGLYKVFLREEEVLELSSKIDIQDGDDIAFIKFTMLAGRLW